MLRSHQPLLAGRGELPACRRLPDGTVAEDTAPGAEETEPGRPNSVSHLQLRQMVLNKAEKAIQRVRRNTVRFIRLTVSPGLTLGHPRPSEEPSTRQTPKWQVGKWNDRASS